MKNSSTIIGAAKLSLAAAALAAVAALSAAGCSHAGGEPAPEAFAISDTLMKYLTIDTVRTEPVTGELRLSGKIVPDEAKLVDLYPLVGGHVEDVTVEVGDFVEAGKVLAVVRSGEVADLQQQLNAAESNDAIAVKNLAVTKDLYESKLASEKDYLTAQREREKAEGEVRKTRQMLSIYDIGNPAEYVVKAPFAGFVTEKHVTRGMQIRSDRDEKLFTVAGLSEVWVMANVYESDIGKVRAGCDASVTTLSYGDKVFTGKVDRLYNVLDPLSKVMKVRIRLKNPDYLLKPEMFANVTVRFPEGKEMLAVPSGSVIFDKNRNFVMVYRSKSDVETREIGIYKNTAGVTFVNAGLRVGDEVIAKNHLLIYAALNE